MKAALCALLSAVLNTLADAESSPNRSLGDLTIEELMNESVTSVSKRETKLTASPAAIAIVTPEDIRRLGITSIPEALRLVPGLDVARISVNEWAVSARGFNSEFANKLLVLVDGRTIYTPASGGVFWNGQDAVLEDLDRIEVIRGPGATLWGSNAVNGVINVTTKSAKETQGVLIATSAGTEERPSATVRYGGQLAPNFFYRAHVKYFDRRSLVDSAGRVAPDDWNRLGGGFRMDWMPSTGNDLTLQGDFYRSDAGKGITQLSLSPLVDQPIGVVSHNSGGNVLARWTRTFSETSALTVQSYYDRVKQGDGFGSEYRDTFDFDVQHRLELGANHDVVWGAGYRATDLRNTPSFNLTWTPERQQFHLFNLFAQDDVTLVRNRLWLTLGSKFERNDLTGWEIQPSVRLRWTPTAHQTVWTAVARADRVPSYFEQDSRLNTAAFQPGPLSPPILVSLFGNASIADEELTAYEGGYRIAATSKLSFDFTGFFNRYEDILAPTPEPMRFEASPGPPHLVLPLTWHNALTGETYGTELSAHWQVTDRWRLAGSHTFLNMRVRPDATAEAESPRHQFQLRSYFELARQLELNSAAYYVGSVTPPSGGTTVRIPAYIRLDLGFTWRPAATIEIGVWGQNLLDRQHAEFASQESVLLRQVPRSVTAKATWRY